MPEPESAAVRLTAVVPQFTVPDLVRTAEYYRDVLGFHIAGYWDGEQTTSAPTRPGRSDRSFVPGKPGRIGYD